MPERHGGSEGLMEGERRRGERKRKKGRDCQKKTGRGLKKSADRLRGREQTQKRTGKGDRG